MGNGCCNKTEQKDKDFDVESIYTLKDKQQENNKKDKIILININFENDVNFVSEFKKIPLVAKLEETKINIANDFNYNSNSQNDSFKNYTDNYKKEKAKKNMMSLVKHISFGKAKTLNTIKFLKEINKARTDLAGISEKLMYFANNFYLIENKIDEINDQKIKKILSADKEKFKVAAIFFSNLCKEKTEKKEDVLKELIEIDDFKLPIPLDLKEMKNPKYHQKFIYRFNSKYSNKFMLKRISFNIVHNDLEISFLLLIAIYLEKLLFLFENDFDYIGIDFRENTSESMMITFAVVSDL